VEVKLIGCERRPGPRRDIVRARGPRPRRGAAPAGSGRASSPVDDDDGRLFADGQGACWWGSAAGQRSTRYVHDLRRTCATGCACLGASESTVSRILGKGHRRHDRRERHLRPLRSAARDPSSAGLVGLRRGMVESRATSRNSLPLRLIRSAHSTTRAFGPSLPVLATGRSAGTRPPRRS
jgi:hypothetical protein